MIAKAALENKQVTQQKLMTCGLLQNSPTDGREQLACCACRAGNPSLLN